MKGFHKVRKQQGDKYYLESLQAQRHEKVGTEIEKLVLRTYSTSKDSEKMIQSRNQDHGHADEETVRIRDYNEERTRTRTEIRVRKRSRTGMRREYGLGRVRSHNQDEIKA